MGLTFRLGQVPLAIFTDTSNNVGIGAAASGSYKFQVTGTTNLTGALSGTSATFSSTLTTNGNIVYINGAQPETRYNENDVGGLPLGLWRTVLGGDAFYVQKNTAVAGDFSTAINCLQITNTGNATFSSGITTNSTIQNNLVGGSILIRDNGTAQVEVNIRHASNRNGVLSFTENGVADRWAIGTKPSDGTLYFSSAFDLSAPKFTLSSAGAATFSSSVTANNYVITAGNNTTIINSASATTGWQQIAMNNTSGSTLLGVEGSTAGTLATGTTAYATLLRNYTSTDLQLATNNIVRTTITSGGNVGIGTNSPNYLLDIWSTSATLRIRNITAPATGGTSSLLFEGINNFSGTSQSFINSIQAGNSGATQLVFGTSGTTDGTATERMRITNGGSLLVGTTANDFGSRQVNNSATSYTFHSVRTGTGSEGHLVFSNANGAVGSIFTNASATSYNTSSDYRLKEDLKEINGLEKLSLIKVYDFKWKASNERTDGVIAHELAEVLPYAVTGEKDAEMMQGVDYSKIVPILIKSIQELELRIKQLENK